MYVYPWVPYPPYPLKPARRPVSASTLGYTGIGTLRVWVWVEVWIPTGLPVLMPNLMVFELHEMSWRRTSWSNSRHSIRFQRGIRVDPDSHSLISQWSDWVGWRIVSECEVLELVTLQTNISHIKFKAISLTRSRVCDGARFDNNIC